MYRYVQVYMYRYVQVYPYPDSTCVIRYMV